VFAPLGWLGIAVSAAEARLVRLEPVTTPMESRDGMLAAIVKELRALAAPSRAVGVEVGRPSWARAKEANVRRRAFVYILIVWR